MYTTRILRGITNNKFDFEVKLVNILKAKKYFLILVSLESRTKNHNIHDLGIYFCIVAFEIGRPAR